MSNKLSSRKFAVWLMWLIITVLVILSSTIMSIVIKEESLSEIVKQSLDSFYKVSMMYLGMNVGQKTAFAISDIFKKFNKEEKKDEVDSDIE